MGSGFVQIVHFVQVSILKGKLWNYYGIIDQVLPNDPWKYDIKETALLYYNDRWQSYDTFERWFSNQFIIKKYQLIFCNFF